MINSILNRHKDPVRFDNIKLAQDIITDPPAIKAHIQKHFDNWTTPRVVNQNLFNSRWQGKYTSKPSINPDWYTAALSEISQEEVLTTISQLPNNKACGPSDISYEMLKHAGSKFQLAITSLFNRVSLPKLYLNNGKKATSFLSSKNPSS